MKLSMQFPVELFSFSLEVFVLSFSIVSHKFYVIYDWHIVSIWLSLPNYLPAERADCCFLHQSFWENSYSTEGYRDSFSKPYVWAIAI